MVGRIRDFHGRVINPKDHFVLPNKQKLSRSDVRDILSDPSVWRGNIQSLIPQLLDYMVSPWKGAPTVAKKVRGGAPGLEAFAGNPALASLLTGHYARRTTPAVPIGTPFNFAPLVDDRKRKSDSGDPVASGELYKRYIGLRNQANNTNMRHTSTAPTPFNFAPLVDERKRKSDSNHPYQKRPPPVFNFKPLPGNSGPPAPFNFKPLPGHARNTASPPTSKPKPVPGPTNSKPAATPQNRNDLPTYAEWGDTKPTAKNDAPPAASMGNVAAPPPPPGVTLGGPKGPKPFDQGTTVPGGTPGDGKVNGYDYGTGESKSGEQGDDEPPPYRPRPSGHGTKVPGRTPAPAKPPSTPPAKPIPPVAPPPPPAPPVMPIPPISAPVAPPVRGEISPLSWLMDEAFRQNRTAIIQKLYPLIGSKRAHALPIVDLVKVAGISEDEFVQLTDLHRAGNVLNFPVSDNTGISSNGIPIVHVHGPEQFGPRSGPARPVVIRTNAGTNKIKSFA